MGKSIFLSRTMWFNGLSIVATGAGFFSGSLSAYPEVVTALVIIQAIANIALRFITVEPIAPVRAVAEGCCPNGGCGTDKRK